MTVQRSASATVWVLLVGALPAGLVRCSGTEADNPIAEEVVVTACKSKSDYDPTQIDDFVGRAREMQVASASEVGVPKATDSQTATRPTLTPTADVPAGLACVEWQLASGALAVQIINFDAGCGVEWQGRTTRAGDRLSLVLDNRICAVAACGNCLYDTATVIEPFVGQDVTLALSLDAACDGQPEVSQWRLPLGAAPQGMLCEYARPIGLGEGNGGAFERCEQPGRACADGLTCVGDDTSAHCLPACAVDADCPLSGGTRCEAGACVPADSRD